VFKEVHLDFQGECSNVLNREAGSLLTTTTTTIEENPFFLHETFQNKSGIMMRGKKCGKTFKSIVKFRFHANEVHNYEWVCLVCCQIFSSRKSRARHMKENHRQVLSCTVCPKKCYDKIGLKQHFRSKHPGEEFVPLSTPTTPGPGASQPVDIQGVLFIHEIIPQRSSSSAYQLKCKICDGLFSSHVKFNNHARSHGYKIFCNYCSQVFSQKGMKKSHTKLVHVYPCQSCGKKFRAKNSSTEHSKAKNHKMESHQDESISARLRSEEGPNYLNNKDLGMKNVSLNYDDEEYENEEYEDEEGYEENNEDEVDESEEDMNGSDDIEVDESYEDSIGMDESEEDSDINSESDDIKVHESDENSIEAGSDEGNDNNAEFDE
jgi:hypothetical protein